MIHQYVYGNQEYTNMNVNRDIFVFVLTKKQKNHFDCYFLNACLIATSDSHSGCSTEIWGILQSSKAKAKRNNRKYDYCDVMQNVCKSFIDLRCDYHVRLLLLAKL